jgi:hypothetical protein
MKIEDTIRARLESILANDARNHLEISISTGDPTGRDELPDQERSFYERIINTYRTAVREVNCRFEENVGFLSGFSQLVDNVRDKNDFQVICSYILDCVLQDFGAEYCSLVFFDADNLPGSISLEGTREEWKFVTVHSRPEILGSPPIQQILRRLEADPRDPFIVDDVYREPEFARVDFPNVVRCIACIPVISGEKNAGLLIAGHSRPKYFTQNHLRVLKILSGFVSHLHYLTCGKDQGIQSVGPDLPKSEDVLSIALADFQVSDPLDRWVAPHVSLLSSLRTRLYRAVEGIGSVVFHGDQQLLVLVPGLPAKEMHSLAGRMRQEFLHWKSDRNEALPAVKMDLGYLTCDGDIDLERVLDVIHHKTHPDATEEAVGAL